MLYQEDTIAAIITNPGIGAMGAIRISGPDAFTIAQKAFRSKSGLSIQEMGPYHLAYGFIFDGELLLDQALLLKMQGPNSFTGEDVAELQCHGGPLVLSKLLQVLANAGARLARPGEFSQRAFLNGKMDLAQAEAIMDLVAASNQKAAKAAAAQMKGSLSEKIKEMKDEIIGWIAGIEADIDFPDEALDGFDRAGMQKAVADMLKQVDELLATAAFSRIYREGLRLVFYGRPNVGKSSLLNGLLKQKRAIVTAEAGTTRDILEERFLLQGVPVILMDTAGIRHSENLAEKEGIDRARQAAQKADLVLFVFDLVDGLTQEDQLLLADLDPEKTLVVANKSDLLEQIEVKLPAILDNWEQCIVSAFDEQGLQVLMEQIKKRFLAGKITIGDSEVLINDRQEKALVYVKKGLESILEGLLSGQPADLISIDLQNCWSALGEITGETVKEAMITEIFSRFCLGK
jgi:tRNA modification GTPase